jgi:hypothetical protein
MIPKPACGSQQQIKAYHQPKADEDTIGTPIA